MTIVSFAGVVANASESDISPSIPRVVGRRASLEWFFSLKLSMVLRISASAGLV